MLSLRVVAGSSAVMTACALGKHEAQALLQVTSSKHIQNAIQKMDTLKFTEDVSLQDMKEQMNEFKDHIASVLQDPSTVSATDIKLLTDLIAQLDSIFLAELTRQKARDVARYDTKLSQHVKCTTDKNKRMNATTGDVTKDLKLVSEKREKHKGCRKAQHSFGLFKADARAVGLATFGNAVGVADFTPVPQIDTLCAKKASWDADTSFYKNLAMVNHVDLCATEQKDFEDIMCAALTAKASTCVAYDECIEAVNLTNEKIVTQTECSARLDVEVILAKTKCHLLHLSKVFNNENSTSDCDSVTVDNSSLACSLQAVPAVSPCSSEADITSPTLPSPPGSDCSAWITAEYSSFGASYTQVTTCQIEGECILPTEIGTHDFSDGCTDAADYCNFYDRHRDACSDYATDDAATHCCACGGGTPRSCDAAVDCSGHGTSTDLDSSNGCVCECADGYTGADCSEFSPWQLAMKTTGDSVFGFSSALWTNSETLNEDSPVNEEANAKYDIFNTGAFQKMRLCVGGPQDNCMEHTLSEEYSSARNLFASGFVRDTNIDQSEILRTFAPVSGTYANCGMQRPGFNIQCNDGNKARFGYCANCANQVCQLSDNSDADAAIGIGLAGQSTPSEMGGGWTNYFAAGAGQCWAATPTAKSAWLWVKA